MNKGIFYGIAAYGMWGIFPIYFKLLDSVPSTQIVASRIIWSFALLMALVALRGEWPEFSRALRSPRKLVVYLLAASLLSVNWLLYVWGVNAGFIVETSLGYFINPLVSILLGVVFLGERLRPGQWAPIGLAAAGVAYMTIHYGRLPWIALTLAITFGAYGLVKKLAPLNSLHGLSLETGLMLLPALGFLAALEARGGQALGHAPVLINLGLIGLGLITTAPLLAFGAAARMIPLSLLGLLQYIAPTGQFLIGVLLYHEPFDQTRLIGFSLIWLALIALWVEGLLTQRRLRTASTTV